MDRKESSSGAPRNIEGIKSTNVWVIAIEVMKITRIKGEVRVRKNAERLRRITAIKLMWIPGVMPVIVPAVIPSKIAMIISTIIFRFFAFILAET